MSIDPKKKRGRPRATEKVSTASVQSESLDDDSILSGRNRRAAAQVADQKLAQVQSLLKATKLRRPTDFDEKPNKQVKPDTQSPPAKFRRTRRKQSAGSCSSVEEPNNDAVKATSYPTCTVDLERLNTPKIKSLTRHSSKRKSDDLFDDNSQESETTSENNKKLKAKKKLSKNLTKELLNKENQAVHSDPMLFGSPQSEPEFIGFSVQSLNEQQPVLTRGNTFIKHEAKSDSELQEKKIKPTRKRLIQNKVAVDVGGIASENKNGNKTLSNKELNKDESDEAKESDSCDMEVDLIKEESPNIRSRTKVIKPKVKSEDDEEGNEERITGKDNKMFSNKELNKEENDNAKERSYCEEEEDTDEDKSPKLRSRTRVIKKNDNFEKSEEQSNKEVEKEESPIPLSRTRVISKNKQNEEVGVVETQTSRKCAEKDDQDDQQSSEEDSNARSRTKTIVKATTSNDVNSKENNRKAQHLPMSPATAKGELVKKRIEDFEKMKKNNEEKEEENPLGRLTRNALKNKAAVPEEDKKDKQNKNAMSGLRMKAPPSSERTPLTNNLRPDDKNRTGSKIQRPTPVDNSTVLVQRQAAEEAERKKREEELQRRQVKEEEAKKKKEKTLKATAEEARRKRENKLLKVAASREAAEKEKAALVAKAEKEKEEKMLLLAAEKKRQQEEHQKKKLLMQQKALEHEERRKQEEAARRAKIREQEEEQKRIIAMKEREMEQQKHRMAELKLAEAEKLKHQQQNSKLGKLAAVNNANLKLKLGVTPSEKAAPSQSYEITPCREDRPLLMPKSENDYGIDDANSSDSSDEESRPKKVIPAWAQSKNRPYMLRITNMIPQSIINLQFSSESLPNPDVAQIFKGNPIKKRMRTSSAIWLTPPRCTHFKN